MSTTFAKLSTVYPTAAAIAAHTAQLQIIANEKNGGEIGKLVRLFTYDSGAEQWSAPALEVQWKEEFN